MKLSELEVVGFKSFAAKTTFTFGDGLTAIVGPNGSGKSNVAEAIRWVLGETSLKALRGTKTEDIIFTGSEARARSPRARVRLSLNNETGRMPLPAAQIDISRSIDRSGEGDFLLNGEVVRLLDIRHLLAEAGFGAKSYAVISQGAIDQYITARPQERRELFDEACGVKSLQLKLTEATSKLDQALAQAQEIQLVINELKPRLTVLKRQVSRYEQRADIERSLEETRLAWYQQQWHQLSRAVTDAAKHQVTQAKLAKVAGGRRAVVENQLLKAAAAVAQAPAAKKRRATLVSLLQVCRTLVAALRQEDQQNRVEIVEQLEAQLNEMRTLITRPAKKTGAQVTQMSADLGESRDYELAAQRAASAAEEQHHSVKKARNDLEEEMQRELGSSEGIAITNSEPDDQVDQVSYEQVQQLAGQLAVIGEIDPVATKEYQEVSKRYSFLKGQLRDAAAAQRQAEKLMKLLRTDIDERWHLGFKAIDTAFQEFFTQLFEGGHCKLKLIETETPEAQGAQISRRDQGVEITAQPPGKRARQIMLLSGGERALTSLALLLAILKVQQPPFIVLDEVDAALDEANSRKFVVALKELSKTTQCIVITHNRETMAQAEVLYGITMDQAGVSQVYSVKTDQAAQVSGLKEMAL